MKHNSRRLLNFASSLVLLSTAMPNLAFADSLKDHEEAFMKAKTEQAEYFAKQKEAIESGAPFDVASGSCKYISSIFNPPPSKVVTLTFDDGPAANLTPQVLNILKKYDIQATFFMKGDNAKANMNIVRRAQSEGHMIASHSWSHPNFHSLSQEQQKQQISDTDQVIHDLASPRKLFRYPYGNSTCFTNSYVKTLGYTGIVGWHVDTCDWAFARNGSVTPAQAKICEVSAANRSNFVGHVMAEVNRNNGGIVLLHDVHANTVQSVEEIIVRLKKAGYRFTNMDDVRMSGFIN